MKDYKRIIANKINAPLDKAELLSYITETADDAFGDYAFPCFKLAKVMRMPPVQIALKLAEEVELDDDVVKVEAVNGYLNFFINRIEFVNDALSEVLLKGENFG
ncbi:MAG: arginine--tRNA ligase, partial [Clostridia bacterium]|nr:arginine--tRNA ligase [Clostridia bacterium]